MAKTGRPSKYTPKLGKRICSLIIDGYTLRNIESQKGMPSKRTMMRWLAGSRGDFRHQYARAKELQAELMAEEILDIANDGTNDWITREDKDDESYYVLNGEHVQRSKLRVDTYKWLMSKMIPKKYGDKVQLTGGDGEGPIEVKEDVRVTFVDAKQKA